MITSEMLSLRQFKNFFYGKVMFSFWDFSYFKLLYQVMYWWALADKLEYAFESIIWILNHLDMKISHSHLITIFMGNIFKINFVCLGWFVSRSKPFFIYQLTIKFRKLITTGIWLVSIINQKLTGFIIVLIYQNHKSAWN